VEEVMPALEGATVQRPQVWPVRKVAWKRATVALLGVIAAAVLGTWWWTRATDSVRFPLEQFTLANGLEVALSPDYASPTFTLTVAYRAGWWYESEGKTGIAHLMEHLMFQGSPNVGRGEFNLLVTGAGGLVNGMTKADITYFWTTLPSNQLELALFLDADRMRALEITPEGMSAARATVTEEHGSYWNNAYARVLGRARVLSFDNPANRRDGFGNLDEVNRLTIEDVAAYHREWYGPSNAGVVLVGNFDPAKAKERIRHYFEGIPRRDPPAAPDIHEPGRKSETREIAPDLPVASPILVVSWRIPKATDPDWFYLKTLSEVLGEDDAARLQTALVKNAGVVADVQAGAEDSEGPNILSVEIFVAKGKDPSQAESLLYREVERIAREGVPADELERVTMAATRSRVFQLVSTAARSTVFAYFLTGYRALPRVNDWESGEKLVKSDDIRRVAAKYLTPENRTVLVATPRAGQQ
jgi:zinc protease